MPDCNRPSHNVELCAIHLTNWLREACAPGPPLRFESFEVRQHLRRKRFVHLHEIDILQFKPRTLERDRRCQYRRLEQLLARIQCRVSVGPDDSERRIAERLCFFFAHEQDAGAAIGER